MTGDGPRPLANNRGKRSIPSGGVYDARHFVSRLSLIVGLERPFPISSPPPHRLVSPIGGTVGMGISNIFKPSGSQKSGGDQASVTDPGPLSSNSDKTDIGTLPQPNLKIKVRG